MGPQRPHAFARACTTPPYLRASMQPATGRHRRRLVRAQRASTLAKTKTALTRFAFRASGFGLRALGFGLRVLDFASPCHLRCKPCCLRCKTRRIDPFKGQNAFTRKLKISPFHAISCHLQCSNPAASRASAGSAGLRLFTIIGARTGVAATSLNTRPPKPSR